MTENDSGGIIDETTKCNYNGIAMELEWDEDKAAHNLNKHLVAFDDAALVFYDELRIEMYDNREDYGEDRWITIGQASSTLLYVAYTVRNGDTIRLISARKADEQERKKYREANS